MRRTICSIVTCCGTWTRLIIYRWPLIWRYAFAEGSKTLSTLGSTRICLLEARGNRWMLVNRLMAHVQAMGLRNDSQCTKLKDPEAQCPYCDPVFPRMVVGRTRSVGAGPIRAILRQQVSSAVEVANCNRDSRRSVKIITIVSRLPPSNYVGDECFTEGEQEQPGRLTDSRPRLRRDGSRSGPGV